MEKHWLEEIFSSLKQKKFIGKFKPALEAAENMILGPGEVTPSAPHFVDSIDLKRYMSMVIIALMPSTLAAIYFYGWRAVAMILVSYIAGGLTEVMFAVIRKKEIHEGFLVTGLIFPLVLPPTLPLWIVAVGSVFGVFFGKEVFGGTGRNVFNPAIVGRVFITIAFPLLMTTRWFEPLTGGAGGFVNYSADTITSATPLIIQKTGGMLGYSYFDLLLGLAPGSMGETFRLGIIIAGIFLIITKISNWRIPAAYLGTVAVLSAAGNIIFPAQVAPPVLQLLSGGLLFGAFFMATDPVTSPFTSAGMWIFGIGLGILTVVFRSFGSYVEGVMFSILLMNALTPLIDNLVLNKKYQSVNEKAVVSHE